MQITKWFHHVGPSCHVYKKLTSRKIQSSNTLFSRILFLYRIIGPRCPPQCSFTKESGVCLLQIYLPLFFHITKYYTFVTKETEVQKRIIFLKKLKKKIGKK